MSGLPAMECSGLPGNRVEAYRAGMRPSTFISGQFYKSVPVYKSNLRKPRVSLSQQNGRMRRDDELRLVINQPVKQRQHAQLPLRGQCGLRFVKQINAVAFQTVQQ